MKKTKSIKDYKFGYKANTLIWSDGKKYYPKEKQENLNANYTSLIDRYFNQICRSKGSSGTLMMMKEYLFYNATDKVDIDFYKVFEEAKSIAYTEIKNNKKTFSKCTYMMF